MARLPPAECTTLRRCLRLCGDSRQRFRGGSSRTARRCECKWECGCKSDCRFGFGCGCKMQVNANVSGRSHAAAPPVLLHLPPSPTHRTS
eukprot:363227-Chlamydomonas_euryale.AAC.2